MAQSKPGPLPSGTCPICGDRQNAAVRPFCSTRCANVDLLRWLRGGYQIAGREEEDEDGEGGEIARAKEVPHEND